MRVSKTFAQYCFIRGKKLAASHLHNCYLPQNKKQSDRQPTLHGLPKRPLVDKNVYDALPLHPLLLSPPSLPPSFLVPALVS